MPHCRPNQDGDIIREFLQVLKAWAGGAGAWRLRYSITDDSAAEQRGVRDAFQGLKEGATEVSHFLCRNHSEESLKRNLKGPQCKQAFQYLYSALYYRHTSMGCEQSIEAAMRAAPEHKKKYIKTEWWIIRNLWAYYARQHSCLLLQCMTTNVVESWHHSIKTHAEGKAQMTQFVTGSWY
ncbi:hypothetical protein N7G274_002540 [Stereocaulon virgatum]|uniref:MULE transposase domain-containing protein n=1 Tax=Stereocaulon virgatum TaxID=373712 RepID=A0ABR4AG87_9LECA